MIGLDDLCLATGGQLYGEATVREFSGISDDPARVRPGELFVVSTIPESGRLMPAITCRRVVLPDPLRPISTACSPAAT